MQPDPFLGLVAALPEVYLFAKDAQSRFRFLNRQAWEGLGASSEAEALGKTDSDFHPPTLAMAYLEEDRLVMEQGPISNRVWLVHHLGLGLPQWVVSSKAPLMSVEGQVIGVLGAMYPLESAEMRCSVHREDAHNELHYDFRPQKTSGRAVKEPSDGRLVAMRGKLRTEEGKALYGRRNHTVEPVFGIIKAAMGFRGFSLRGKEKVSGEWTLVCLAYNLRRLHGMMGGAKDGAGRPESGSMGGNPSPILPVDKWLGRIIHTIFRQLHRLTTESTAKLVLTPTGS